MPSGRVVPRSAAISSMLRSRRRRRRETGSRIGLLARSAAQDVARDAAAGPDTKAEVPRYASSPGSRPSARTRMTAALQCREIAGRARARSRRASASRRRHRFDRLQLRPRMRAEDVALIEIKRRGSIQAFRRRQIDAQTAALDERYASCRRAPETSRRHRAHVHEEQDVGRRARGAVEKIEKGRGCAARLTPPSAIAWRRARAAPACRAKRS